MAPIRVGGDCTAEETSLTGVRALPLSVPTVPCAFCVAGGLASATTSLLSQVIALRLGPPAYDGIAGIRRYRLSQEVVHEAFPVHEGRLDAPCREAPWKRVGQPPLNVLIRAEE